MSATRRGFLATLGSVGGAAFAATPTLAAAEPKFEPFYGAHQAGIVTPSQTHAYFLAFDLTTGTRGDVARLMKTWTDAAARLSAGQAPEAVEIMGLDAARLTITFGFGPGLFEKGGLDRFGLKSARPAAFVDLPSFPGEQLAPVRTGGDILIQVCADNPQVAFHAGRALNQLADKTAALRWVQAGFVSNYGDGKTPRNLMGFKDGTGNPHSDDPRQMSEVVWAGAEAPQWMRGGTYAVVRRARMALEHWERTQVGFQEQTFGRRKLSGAPLGGEREFDVVDLDAKDNDGNPVTPENSHVSIARRAAEGGMRVLRRSYSYNDGANLTAERWPPWRQGMEFDAGLVFVCFQRDLRTGFIPIFENMSRFDMMNQFVTNTGGGHWACPAGAREGDYVGRALLEG